MPKTLLELSNKHSGIVIHRNRRPIVCDWSDILGLPRWFGDEVRGVGEDIPAVPGHYFYNLEDADIDLSRLDTHGRPVPQRGTVYVIGDCTVIAPDEWE